MRYLFFLFLVSVPAISMAQYDKIVGGTNNEPDGLSFTVQSPLAANNITSAEGLITSILNVLLIIAVPVIVFFIIYAGFSYVTAQGNPQKITDATRSITYALIGAVLILGAVAISEIVAGVVNELRT